MTLEGYTIFNFQIMFAIYSLIPDHAETWKYSWGIELVQNNEHVLGSLTGNGLAQMPGQEQNQETKPDLSGLV